MPDELLPWTSENLTKVIADLLKEAALDSTTRTLLRDPEYAKTRVAARFVTLPRDWADRTITFDPTPAPPLDPTSSVFSVVLDPEILLDEQVKSLTIDMSLLGTASQRATFRICRRPPLSTKAHVEWVD